jgi:hypothetical protein
MTLLVTSASGNNGAGFGRLLAFADDGKLIGPFSDDPRLVDPRGLGIDPVHRMLFVNSGSGQILALDRNGEVVRATRQVDGLNPGGGNRMAATMSGCAPSAPLWRSRHGSIRRANMCFRRM